MKGRDIMNREQMESYRSMKEEIKEITYKLDHLGKDDEFVGNDVINDYRSGFPVPQSVVGFDYAKYRRAEERYSKRLEKLKKDCQQIEEFIECVQDSMTRRIFRMYFMEGLSQRQIARQMHIDQSTVSRKMNEYFSKNI